MFEVIIMSIITILRSSSGEGFVELYTHRFAQYKQNRTAGQTTSMKNVRNPYIGFKTEIHCAYATDK